MKRHAPLRYQFCNERADFPLEYGTKGWEIQPEITPNIQDVVIQKRALIHHIDDLNVCFKEGYRVLKNKGVYIIQDRTPEDCLLEGNHSHIRGYIF